MKKKLLFHFTIILLVSCSKRHQIECEVLIGNSQKKYSLDTCRNILKISPSFSGREIGRVVEFDSLNIIRRISFYHGTRLPFYTFRYSNAYMFTEMDFRRELIDTSLILTPYLNFYRDSSKLYLEVIPVNYPSKYTKIHVETTNIPLNARFEHDKNAAYFEINEEKRQNEILINFVFSDDSGRAIKSMQKKYSI